MKLKIIFLNYIIFFSSIMSCSQNDSIDQEREKLIHDMVHDKLFEQQRVISLTFARKIASKEFDYENIRSYKSSKNIKDACAVDHSEVKDIRGAVEYFQLHCLDDRLHFQIVEKFQLQNIIFTKNEVKKMVELSSKVYAHLNNQDINQILLLRNKNH
jgi:hypothetical protein